MVAEAVDVYGFVPIALTSDPEPEPGEEIEMVALLLVGVVDESPPRSVAAAVAATGWTTSVGVTRD